METTSRLIDQTAASVFLIHRKFEIRDVFGKLDCSEDAAYASADVDYCQQTKPRRGAVEVGSVSRGIPSRRRAVVGTVATTAEEEAALSAGRGQLVVCSFGEGVD